MHDLVDVGLLVWIGDLHFALLRPFLTDRILARPRYYFAHVGLIVEIIASLGHMLAILLALLDLEELALLDLLQWIEVFFL